MNIKLVNKQIFHECLGVLPQLNNLPDQINLSIDSREITPGCIFLALLGETHDGHDFIESALKQQASLIIARESSKNLFAYLDQTKFIFVPDTLKILWALAHCHINKFNIKKIAITGSNGKTTTKEMLKACLVKIFGPDKIFANPGNKNNHIGLPMCIFDINIKHEIAVLEMGMNHAGEIRDLCNIVEPTYGLITNIGPAHAGNFINGFDGIQHAKGELFAALNHKHTVINIDDARVMNEAQKNNFKSSTTFGKNKLAQVRLVDTKPFDLEKNYQEVIITTDDQNHKSYNIKLPMAGEHHAKNLTAALAMIKELGLSLEVAAQGIEHMIIIAGRMNIVRSTNNIIYVDDAYNANPESMNAGINTCSQINAQRRIAVIGNMGELGEMSYEAHLNLGAHVAQVFDYLFVCGEAAKAVITGAKNHGLSDKNIYFVNDADQAINQLRNFVIPGDLVFIKGSKINKMIKIAPALNN